MQCGSASRRAELMSRSETADIQSGSINWSWCYVAVRTAKRALIDKSHWYQWLIVQMLTSLAVDILLSNHLGITMLVQFNNLIDCRGLETATFLPEGVSTPVCWTTTALSAVQSLQTRFTLTGVSGSRENQTWFRNYHRNEKPYTASHNLYSSIQLGFSHQTNCGIFDCRIKCSNRKSYRRSHVVELDLILQL